MHNTTCPPNNHTRLLRAAHSRWYNRQAAGGSLLIMRRGRFQAGWPRHTHTHTSFKPDLAGKCTGEKSLCTSIRNKGSLVNVSPSPSSCHLVNGSNPKEPLWCQPTQCTPSTAQDTSGVFGGERITVQELNYLPSSLFPHKRCLTRWVFQAVDMFACGPSTQVQWQRASSPKS